MLCYVNSANKASVSSNSASSLRQQTELVNYKALLADVECVFAVAELEKRDTRMDVRQELKAVELSSEAVDDTPLTHEDDVKYCYLIQIYMYMYMSYMRICAMPQCRADSAIAGSHLLAATMWLCTSITDIVFRYLEHMSTH
jgi:hypothetical protein